MKLILLLLALAGMGWGQQSPKPTCDGTETVPCNYSTNEFYKAKPSPVISFEEAVQVVSCRANRIGDKCGKKCGFHACKYRWHCSPKSIPLTSEDNSQHWCMKVTR